MGCATGESRRGRRPGAHGLCGLLDQRLARRTLRVHAGGPHGLRARPARGRGRGAAGERLERRDSAHLAHRARGARVRVRPRAARARVVHLLARARLALERRARARLRRRGPRAEALGRGARRGPHGGQPAGRRALRGLPRVLADARAPGHLRLVRRCAAQRRPRHRRLRRRHPPLHAQPEPVFARHCTSHLTSSYFLLL